MSKNNKNEKLKIVQKLERDADMYRRVGEKFITKSNNMLSEAMALKSSINSNNEHYNKVNHANKLSKYHHTPKTQTIFTPRPANTLGGYTVRKPRNTRKVNNVKPKRLFKTLDNINSNNNESNNKLKQKINRRCRLNPKKHNVLVLGKRYSCNRNKMIPGKLQNRLNTLLKY